jgi:hypothetical protein
MKNKNLKIGAITIFALSIIALLSYILLPVAVPIRTIYIEALK